MRDLLYAALASRVVVVVQINHSMDRSSRDMTTTLASLVAACAWACPPIVSLQSI
jgi:hypothetical protein